MAEYVVERGDTAPLFISVDRRGGFPGLFPVVAIRDGLEINTPVYLDFATGAFTIAGWTTRLQTLTEIGTVLAPGQYGLDGGLDLSATVSLPTNSRKLIAEFEVRNSSGVPIRVATDVLVLGDSWYTNAQSGSNMGVLPTAIDSIATAVNSELSGIHGAGSWATATGFAVPGDNMGLTPTAIDSSAVAINSLLSGVHGAGSWDGITAVDSIASAVDSILSGAHGAGSWLSATGFAVPGDLMGLATTAIDSAAVAINSLLSGIHGTGSWEGSPANSVAAEVNSVLSGAHGSGIWEGTTASSVAFEVGGLIVDFGGTPVQTITLLDAMRFTFASLVNTVARAGVVYTYHDLSGAPLWAGLDNDPISWGSSIV